MEIEWERDRRRKSEQRETKSEAIIRVVRFFFPAFFEFHFFKNNVCFSSCFEYNNRASVTCSEACLTFLFCSKFSLSLSLLRWAWSFLLFVVVVVFLFMKVQRSNDAFTKIVGLRKAAAAGWGDWWVNVSEAF